MMQRWQCRTCHLGSQNGGKANRPLTLPELADLEIKAAPLRPAPLAAGSGLGGRQSQRSGQQPTIR